MIGYLVIGKVVVVGVILSLDSFDGGVCSLFVVLILLMTRRANGSCVDLRNCKKKLDLMVLSLMLVSFVLCFMVFVCICF